MHAHATAIKCFLRTRNVFQMTLNRFTCKYIFRFSPQSLSFVRCHRSRLANSFTIVFSPVRCSLFTGGTNNNRCVEQYIYCSVFMSTAQSFTEKYNNLKLIHFPDFSSRQFLNSFSWHGLFGRLGGGGGTYFVFEHIFFFVRVVRLIRYYLHYYHSFCYQISVIFFVILLMWVLCALPLAGMVEQSN